MMNSINRFSVIIDEDHLTFSFMCRWIFYLIKWSPVFVKDFSHNRQDWKRVHRHLLQSLALHIDVHWNFIANASYRIRTIHKSKWLPFGCRKLTTRNSSDCFCNKTHHCIPVILTWKMKRNQRCWKLPFLMLSLWSTRKMISALILRAFFTLSSRVSFTTGLGGGYRNLNI